jgi:hypothetical protein
VPLVVRENIECRLPFEVQPFSLKLLIPGVKLTRNALVVDMLLVIDSLSRSGTLLAPNGVAFIYARLTR